MEIKCNALSLRNTNYSESDKIVTLLTLERGKLAIKARGCRSAKAKLRCAVSPLCFGNYIVYEKGDKFVLTACDVIESFQSLSEDLDKYYVASIILEAADKFSEENSPDAELFFLVINSLKNLSYDNNPAIYALVFLSGLLGKLGYALNVSYGLWFDYENGGLVKSCSSKLVEKLTESEAKILHNLANKTKIDYDITISEIKKLLLVLGRYITYTTNKKLITIKEYINIIK